MRPRRLSSSLRTCPLDTTSQSSRVIAAAKSAGNSPSMVRPTICAAGTPVSSPMLSLARTVRLSVGVTSLT